jgi:hypothetical protein
MVWQASLEVGCATAPPGAGGLHYSVLLCRYSPPGNGPGLPYGGPAQAMGEEDAAAPLQEEGAAGTFDDQGASAPLDAGGVGNDFGGGDDGGDGGENEN